MHSLIRAEVLKLRTVRGPWLLLATGPLLVIAGKERSLSATKTSS